MDLKGKRILVTGSDGFIGSHLVEELVRRGHRVRAFVFYNSFNSWGWLDESEPEVRKSIEVVAGDVRDAFGVKSAMSGCDVVLHLAALIAIPYSYRSPAAFVETNVMGTLNVIQAARECEVQKVVHTSTSETYGTAVYVPIDEKHPLHGQSPYSASKTGADQMAYSYYCSFGVPVAIVRPFNTYGPRQSARAVIPTIISQIATGSTQIKLGSLHPTRDFNYVQDVVRGFIAAAESDASVGETINIGSGFEITIGDTAKLIAEVMKAGVSVVSEDERVRPANSEVERLWASNEKAKRLLDWSPEYAGLDGFRRGIEKTVEWFTRPGNLARYKPDIYNI